MKKPTSFGRTNNGLLFWLFVSVASSWTRTTGYAEAFNPPAAWDFYAKALITKPLLTKSLTACGTNAFSDAICQKLLRDSNSKSSEEGKSKFDSRRLIENAFTGLVWSGPIAHMWYGLLFGKLTVQIKDPIVSLVTQIILDALIFSPVTVSGYFAVRSVLEGSGFAGVKDKLKTRLVSSVLGAWKFWPAANVINFSMVPIPFRVLYLNVLSIFWSGYLTHVNSKKIATSPEA